LAMGSQRFRIASTSSTIAFWSPTSRAMPGAFATAVTLKPARTTTMHAERTIDRARKWRFERAWRMRELLLGIAPVPPSRPGTFLGLLIINVKCLVFVMGEDRFGRAR